VAADKYDIGDMDDMVYDRMMDQIADWETYIKTHHKAQSADQARRLATDDNQDEDYPDCEDLDEAILKARRIWDGVVLTVRFLLENCPEDDSIRGPLLEIGWAEMAVNEFRAAWLELVAAHPGYAVDVLAFKPLSNGSCTWWRIGQKLRLPPLRQPMIGSGAMVGRNRLVCGSMKS